MSTTAGPAALADNNRRIYNPVQKDYATFLKTSEETGGEFTRIEVELAPDGGTSPHYHTTYAEHFEVLQGVLEVRVGNETRTLGPGESAVAPKNTLHSFRNVGDEPTIVLVELRPGSVGFERSLRATYGLARDGRTTSKGIPKNPYQLAVILEWSEMRLPGAFSLMAPVFRVLAGRARRKGIDRELEDAYCR